MIEDSGNNLWPVVDGQTSPPFKVNQIFTLQVGLTDYKDHMGTNLSPEVDQWVGQGEHRWTIAPSILLIFAQLSLPQVGENVAVHRGRLLADILRSEGQSYTSLTGQRQLKSSLFSCNFSPFCDKLSTKFL